MPRQTIKGKIQELREALDPEVVADEIDWPFPEWAHQCHAASIAIVKSKILPRLGYPKRRVARGFASGVMGQHSWIVLGDDCYDRKALIVDPTLWSYRKDVEGIYVGQQKTYGHVPHGGEGSIWHVGRPPNADLFDPFVKELELTPEAWNELDPLAQHFLKMCGPMDMHGWMFLGNAPVAGWPAAEIFLAMKKSGLGPYVPVDRLGMLTDLNPGKAYLPEED